MYTIKIEYGTDTVTIYKKEIHITLTKEELAFAFESAIRHKRVEIKVQPLKN